MTSKVQTITAQIYDMAIEDSAHVQIVALTDALIAASHAEGVAEGTEQERERIRGESQMVGVDEDCIKFIGSVDNYVGAAFLVPVDAMDPPSSVLAPKESPHSQWHDSVIDQKAQP